MRKFDVTVAVLTFHRPESLVACLGSVVEQVDGLVTAANGGVTGRVLVVDNDDGASARSAVLAFGHSLIRYVVESKPGIASARNRALEEAQAVGSDVVVFIDDDERPQAGWLHRLVATWQEHGSVAVAGRVAPVFSRDVSPWIHAGRFFVRRTLPTGTIVGEAATSNLLLDVAQLRILGLRFDERLGLGGGEDTLLTRQITARGGQIVWCDESIVEDHIPIERTTRQWVLKRAWSHGNATAVVDLFRARTRRDRVIIRARVAVGGVARILVGGARAALGEIVRSDRHSARGLRGAFRGAGMAAAAFGVTYREYAREATPTLTLDPFGADSRKP
jgi:glycosyltransferase involved in cell wall biosynthesis